MRILASAYSCCPGRGSEPGVGWNRIRQLARFHEVWAITRATNRQPIEEALAREPLPNVRWEYVDLPRWTRLWKKGRRGIHLYYYLWQFDAYLRARKLHKQVGFDQVHHLTFVNYWLPSFMVLLPVPLVWGPVGGGESPPVSFWSTYGQRGKLFETLRFIARRLGELDPALRMTARRAACALATTPQTEKRLRALGCENVLLYSEAGLPAGDIELLNRLPLRHDSPFRLVSVGELLHLKGFDLGLRGFAKLQTRFSPCEYWVIGAGPERERLEALARKLGVEGMVRFWGQIPRNQVLENLAQCDALVHPSLHDSGGWVCLEAMAAGRPILCLDLGGPGVQVTAETGIKVPAQNPEQAVTDLCDAMLRLAHNPALRARMGEAGRERVRAHFHWDRKGEWLRDLGAQIAGVRKNCARIEGVQNAG